MGYLCSNFLISVSGNVDVDEISGILTDFHNDMLLQFNEMQWFFYCFIALLALIAGILLANILSRFFK